LSVSEKTAGEAYRGSSANDYHSGSERLMMGRGGDDELTADNDGRTMIHGGAGDDVLRADIYNAGIERQVTEVVLRPFRGQLVLLDRASGSAPPPDGEGSYGTEAPAERTTSYAEDLDDEIPF